MISLKSNLRLMAKQGSFEDFFCSKISASPIDHTNAVWFLARGVQKIVLFALSKTSRLAIRTRWTYSRNGSMSLYKRECDKKHVMNRKLQWRAGVVHSNWMVLTMIAPWKGAVHVRGHFQVLQVRLFHSIFYASLTFREGSSQPIKVFPGGRIRHVRGVAHASRYAFLPRIVQAAHPNPGLLSVGHRVEMLSSQGRNREKSLVSGGQIPHLRKVHARVVAEHVGGERFDVERGALGERGAFVVEFVQERAAQHQVAFFPRWRAGTAKGQRQDDSLNKGGKNAVEHRNVKF
mmetsp:Transcript_8119/g.20129  ORF Transcript_8119/g.20129 Transcript_8119/m.20129 type:complete len:290 (+) Transcript_8119:274-1143(+)